MQIKDLAVGDGFVYLNEDSSKVKFYVLAHNYESGLNGKGRTMFCRESLVKQGRWAGPTSSGNYSLGWPDTYGSRDPIVHEERRYLNSEYLNRFDATTKQFIGTTRYYTLGFFTDRWGYYGWHTRVDEYASPIFTVSAKESITSYTDPSGGSLLSQAARTRLEKIFTIENTGIWTRTLSKHTSYEHSDDGDDFYYSGTYLSGVSSSDWGVFSYNYDTYNSKGYLPCFTLSENLYINSEGYATENEPPEVTSDAGATGAELGEKNAPFTVGYTVTDPDGDLMTVTEKLDGEVKATKTSEPPTVVQVQTARNDSGDIPAWDTYPAKSEYFMPLTAKKAGLQLRSLEFRVKGYVPGTMRTVLRKYGSTTALVDKFTDIVRGYNDVVLDMGDFPLEKGVEYQLYFAASNNFYPPSVEPSWVTANDCIDIAHGSAYYGDDTTLIFSGTMVIVDNHLTESGASTAALTVDWLSEKSGYQQVLNGAHTLTLTVSDGKTSTDWTATFTKNVTGAKVSLTAPLTADDTITVAALTLEGSFPADMSLSVEMTNNALDETPVWENCTDIQSGESRAFVHHAFTNKTAVRGFAFNYKVTVARGTSGVGGSITLIGGVIG